MKGIFGLQPIAFVGILALVAFIAAIIIYLWYKQKKRQSNLINTRGKILCEFCSPEGAYSEVCDVFKGQLKKIQSKSRGTFTVDRFINAPKKADQSIDVYYVLQDHCFPYRWPDGKPPDEQVVLMKSHYLVNDPIPKITYKPEEWDAERYEHVTAAIAKYAQDEKVLQVLVSELAGVWKQIEQFVELLKRIPMMFMIQLGQTLILLLIAYFAFKANSNSGSIVNFLKGAGW